MVEEIPFFDIRNGREEATCLAGYGQKISPQETDWSFTRYYLPQVVDAGYRLLGDAQTVWNTFEMDYHRAGFAGNLEIPMESFTREVGIVLKEGEALDASSLPYDVERLMNDATPIELSDEQCSELERRVRSQTIDARVERTCPS